MGKNYVRLTERTDTCSYGMKEPISATHARPKLKTVQRQNFLQLTTKLFTVAGFLEFHGEKLFSLRRSSELRSLNEA